MDAEWVSLLVFPCAILFAGLLIRFGSNLGGCSVAGDDVFMSKKTTKTA